MSDPVRLAFNEKGELELLGRDGQWEPNCAECGNPIRWVLDMFSFTTSPYRLAHAYCVWTKDGFTQPRSLAPRGHA